MKKLICIIGIISIIVIVSIFLKPIIFQKGNPIPLMNGILKLSTKKYDIVEVSKEPIRYITKTSDADSLIKDKMKEDGWDLKDQLGSAYLFTNKDSDTLLVESVQYTEKYTIWTIRSKSSN